MMSLYTTDEIIDALFKAWSFQSSSKWSKDNPANGQCGVTALVVHDLLGGKINKTVLPSGWHFYNVVNGTRINFTSSQFSEEIFYMDISSNREEAFQDTNEDQYRYLKERVLDDLNYIHDNRP